MLIMELVPNLVTNSSSKSKNYLSLLEAVLFTQVCEGLRTYFEQKYKDYFRLIKITSDKENEMMEEMLVKCVVNDILSTEEYTLSGIAYYTQSSEDVLYDIVSGQNAYPSSALFRKIIKLHQTVRPQLYREMLKNINNDEPESKG